ncbi:hypothetical protein J2Z65_006362 [Paenibacillus aceris]|uniref:DUF3923 family protein n=1 Tax=Paenibacillus aceris TaxID=869555 RepID=A0ABS4I863_9BACL|nr:hypothetical protein [Paenibacillus aceris]
MKLPYRIGYLLTVVWFIFIIYGLSNYDSDSEGMKVGIVLFITFAGLVIFPAFYIIVYLYYAYLRKQQK